MLFILLYYTVLMYFCTDTVNVGLAVGLSLGLVFPLILVGAVIAVGVVYAVKTGRLTIAAKGRE